MTERRVYTEEFKREAVRLAKQSGNLCATARNLGIHPTLLQKWKTTLEGGKQNPFPGQGNPQDAEMARLKRENARLSEENEILKKAVGIFTSRPR
jgi:transposase